MRLEGQSAIVTGAGRGIGRAIALSLAQERANVTVVARTQSEIDEVVAQIQNLGSKSLAVQADVSVAAEVERMVERTISEFGSIDILVNNAGGMPSELYGPTGTLEWPNAVWDWPEAFWDKVMETNLKSVFLCLKAVMPQMIAQKRGHIINISSIMGRVPQPGGGGYSVAKHGVISLTQTAGLEAVPYGVKVNAVSPGYIDTPGMRRFMQTLPTGVSFPPLEPPETVAAAVLHLVCEAPEEMVGQSLDLFNIG